MRALQAQNAAYNAASTAVLNRGLPGRMPGHEMLDFNLRGQMRQMDDLTKRIQKGKITWKELQNNIRGSNKLLEYQNALQRASLSSMRAMGNGMYGTQLAIPALTKTNDLLRQQAVNMATNAAAAKAWGRSMMDTGKNMAFMGRQALLSVTAPMALLAGGAAAEFYKVDKQLTQLAKVYGDSASGMVADTDDVRDAAMGLAKEMNRLYAVGTEDTLALASAFAALGESGRNLDYMVSAAARLMQLGDVSTESATKLISTLRTVFQLEGEELQDVINLANTFESQTTLTMQDFADALPKMGSIVKSWGGDMRQAATILEGFTRNGINAVEGANALKSGFTKLVRPTKKLEERFMELTSQFNGKALSLTGIVKEYNGDVPKILAHIGKLQKGWDEYSVKNFQAELWGAYQLNRGMALTSALAEPTEQMQKLLNMSEEEFKNYNEMVANRELAVMMQSSSAQFKQVINDIRIYAAEIGEKILPIVTAGLRFLLDTVKGVAKWTGDLLDTLGPLGTLIAGFGKAAAIAAIAFGPLLLAISSFFLIAGGFSRMMGFLGGGMARMMAAAGGLRGVTLFQTAAQKAAELQAQHLQSRQGAQIATANSLTAALNNLNNTYAKMTATSAAAAAQARKTAMAQASSARLTNAAASGMFGTLTNRQLQTARMGGMVLPNNMNNFNSMNSATKPNTQSGHYLAPTANPLTPSVAAAVTAQRQRTATLAKAGKVDAQAYTNAFSAAAAAGAKRRQQAMLQQASFVSPGRQSTIAGQASEAARRQAAGIGLMNQPAMAATSSAYNSQNAAVLAQRQQAARLAQQQADAARAAQIQERARNVHIARANQLWTEQANKVSGILIAGGMVGSMLAGNNQKLQTGLTIAMGVGTVMAMWPGLLGKVGAGFAAMGTRMAALRGIGPMFAGLGGIIAMAFKPLLIVAGIAGIGYGVYRLMTRDARALQEQNEKIKNTTEGWANLLGYTRTQFGEIVDEAGNVHDTMESLEREILADEKFQPLLDRMRSHATDIQQLTSDLEREAVKMFADGANAEQVKTALELLMNAATLDPITKDELKVVIEDISVTGLNGTDISSALQEEISKTFGSRTDNVASAVQQMIGGKDSFDLSQVAKQRIDAIMSQLEMELRNAEPEQSGEVLNNYFKAIQTEINNKLGELSQEAQNYINEKGGILNLNPDDWETLQGDMGVNYDQYRDLNYQVRALEETLLRLRTAANVPDDMAFMFENLESAIAATAQKQKAAVYDFESGGAAWKASIDKLGPAYDALSEKQKINMLNAFRQASGLVHLSEEAARAALEANNFGNDQKDVAIAAKKTTDQLAEEVGAVEDLAEQFGVGRKFDWSVVVRVDVEGSDNPFELSVEDLVNRSKDTMSGVMDDYMEEMAAEAQIRWDAERRAFEQSQQAAQDALKERQDAEKKAMDERQNAEKKALDKSVEAEKKAFDKSWENRLKDEKAAFDSRIDAIKNTQEAEDELERQRKRNAEREERRLRRLQQMMQTGIDINIALAGGDLEEVSRLSLNAAVNEQDFQTDWNEAEAGYAKEDADMARSKEIERIEAERDARLEMLEQQRDMEREAMEERVEFRREELERKQQMETDALARRQQMQSDYLAKQQEMDNIAYEISFQANQRALNRELEALRTQIPLNEAELYNHMQRVGGAYDAHGVNLMDKGDFWSRVIEDSLIRRVDNARKEMSNEQAWRDYGNRVAEGASRGAFNMSAAEFNRFLRTGEIPDAPKGEMYGPFIQPDGTFRHGGGPIGNDRFNNRGGRSMSAKLGRDEKPIIAQNGEFMMRKQAVNNYGPDFMHAINNGTFNPANAGPAGVSNMNAIGGFGELAASMAAITVGSIISRTVEATGSAMMNALSGGGDIGSISIPQKAGRYGSSVLNETQLKTAALIAEAAKEVGASKRDLKIALMTAFQESAMGTAGMYREVDHDSLGAFQQRAAWGPAADRMDIKKSAKMFFLGGQAGQRGLFDIAGRNAMSPGAAAQAVQVSAHPSAYDKWEDEADAIIAAGIGTLTRREVSKNLRFGDWTTAGIQKYADQWANSAIGATGPMNVQPGEYQHPVPGHPTTSGFGMRWGAMHDGIDIGAPTGTPIYATKAGTVIFASNYDDGGFGLHTVIDHGGGITSGYAHQSRLGARVGDRVAKGQNIGFVGNTGQSTGPHLHFQLGRGQSGGRYNYSTDPRSFGIPGLAVGGNVMYDNTLANLHKGETVLTKPLSEQLRVGIQQLANQGIVGYDDIVELLKRDGHRLLATATEAARNAYDNSTTEQQKIELNFVLQNANINGVDDLERRFREWGDEIIEKIRQEDLAKKRRLGGR